MYLKSGLEEGCPFVGVALYERSYDVILNNGIKYYYYFTFYVTGLVNLGDAHKKGYICEWNCKYFFKVLPNP